MKKARQITALVAIILLAGLYIATFITSFFAGFDRGKAFSICLILTVTIPLLAFVIILFLGRASGKKIIGDPDDIVIPEAKSSSETSADSSDASENDSPSADSSDPSENDFPENDSSDPSSDEKA